MPADLAAEVNRTVVLRGASVDRTWAPWWRAQARAIAHVTYQREPDVAKRDRFLAHELAFADRLESR